MLNWIREQLVYSEAAKGSEGASPNRTLAPNGLRGSSAGPIHLNLTGNGLPVEVRPLAPPKSPSGKLEVKVRLADCRPDEGNGPSARGFCLKLALMGILPAYGGGSGTLPPQRARRPRYLQHSGGIPGEGKGTEPGFRGGTQGSEEAWEAIR